MKNKRILFVTFHDINDSSFGGAQCTQRNYSVLSELASVEVYNIFKKSALKSMKSGFEKNFPPISNDDKNHIIEIIKKNSVEHVFLDHSLMGSLAKHIKNNSTVKITTFFHNVEKDYIGVRFGKSPMRIPYKWLAIINEKMSITYSDNIIALSQRDANRINEIYSRKVDEIIPITFKDKVNKTVLEHKYHDIGVTIEKICLFVGAFSVSNYEGIKWFSDNIAPKLNAKTIIVGKGFDNKVDELSNQKVEVIGFVEDLEKYYLEADCVISPLLSGAGMKVKIAEALMYGKTIFGTTESFEGYDLDYTQVGGLCNSIEEFIIMINSYLVNSTKYNKYSRDIFEQFYSNDRTYKSFDELL